MWAKNLFASLLSVGALVALSPTIASAQADGNVSERLNCGLLAGAPGFSVFDGESWAGFDVELCNLLGQALRLSEESVALIPVTSSNRFDALRSGEIDILMSATGHTATRLLNGEFTYPSVTHYSGQTIMFRPFEDASEVGSDTDGNASSSSSSASGAGGNTPELSIVNAQARALKGAICVLPGNKAAGAAAIFFDGQETAPELLEFATSSAALEAYEADRCGGIIGDQYRLVIQRAELSEPDAHVIAETPIALEPLGPVTREGDDRLTDAVRWLVYALIDPTIAEHEDLGFLLPGLTEALEDGASFEALFQAHFGSLGMPTGFNRSWRDGGLLVTPISAD